MATSTSVSRITAGDLFTFTVTPTDESGATYDLTVGTWTCTVAVFDSTGAQLLSKSYDALTQDSTGFITYLLTTETALFPVTTGNDYHVLAARAVRTDSTPNISIERNIYFEVDKQFIP